MNYLLFFILLLIILFRYIVILLSLIPIRLLLVRDRGKQHDSINNIQCGVNEKKIRSLKTYIGSLLYGYVRYFIIKIGMIPSHAIRNFIYRKVLLVHMEEYVIIYFGSEIRAPYNLRIGKGTIIGDKSILDARNGIEIGENVNFSSNVHIWTEQHDHRDPYFECNSDHSFKVIIENRAWIGPNVTILPKVVIGEGAVVAAGSVVTKNVEPFTIVAGLPAKKIGERNKSLKYVFEDNPLPFY